LRQRRILIGLALVLGLVPLSGCSSVVARVNGNDITTKEFVDELKRQNGLQVLQQLVLRRLVLERAEADKALPTPEEITKAFEEFKQERFAGDEQEMRRWMKASAIGDEQILDQIKYEKAVFNLRTAGVQQDEKALKNFFDEVKDRYFDKPARVSFRQIVVQDKATADKIIAELNNEGELFAQIAKTQSMDQNSAPNGGLYEEFDWKVIQDNAAPVAKALRALKENQITQQPVQHGGGWFVLKLLKSLPAEPANYDDPKTKESVKQAYLQQHAMPEEQLMQKIVAGADVVVLDPDYKTAVEPMFAPGGTGGVPGASGAAGAPGAPGGGLPAGVEPPPLEMTEPTHVEEGAEPQTAPAPKGN